MIGHALCFASIENWNFMHVALNGWFWNRPNSGSGQYVRNLIYHLNRRVSDLELSLICPMTEGSPEDVPPSVQTIMIPNGAGHVGKVVFEQRQFPKAVEECGANVAHVPYWGSPMQCSAPIVVTVHDMTTELVREYRQGIKARLYNALISASARGASHIITDSNSARDDIMRHLKIPAEKVSTVYLGVDTNVFTPDENLLLDMAIRQQYELPDEYILYLGGYEIHKNVSMLLHAYTYVAKALGKDYPLLLAGKKPEKVSERFPDYEAMIERLELTENVRWLGFIERDHKPLLYREAETFVFPSSAEGFGLPPLEAMACGTPVVTTNATSIPEVVGEAAFAVDPDDLRGFAGAIIATIVQENLAAELKQKGLARAQEFKWENTAHETLLIYDQVLQSSKN